MVYMNVAAVVTKALSKAQDDSAEFRAKFVLWFNEISRDVFNQPRDWAFLQTPATITIIANQITLPIGASEIVTMEIGDVILTRDNQIGPLKAFKYRDDTGTTPEGYTLAAGNVVIFYPGASGNCILNYEAEVNTDYTDVATDTIFPIEFESLFITGLRMHSYDYDKDGRYSKESALYEYEMLKIKEWDNRRKPKPEFNSHGYTRTKV